MKFRVRFDLCRWFVIWAALAISGTALASEASEKSLLRNEAVAQLEMAISAVQEAERRKALWIPAAEALDEARAAFDLGEFVQSIELARSARQFAELGIKQLAAPPYRHF
ncbi:MAG: hypothetical protein JSW48_16400 [Betaproteobacteria bacterium]|jgi:hypothetical protein|nr:MAG: hypothetical protein JSW48_16400 [Betaproteobacteria bacterium]